ncbi:probable glycerol-3-phosphate acyltransferase 2 [Pistacia vera]|uniref:probable glycerol-3-phosphate acyltransferase 2 n=1 Tax=Pistacia vera TaxID=55513 RepID=UPI0012636FFF|nr:probable glycerol-3-phosphate acyltransferase 2 [Pistacia vera]
MAAAKFFPRKLLSFLSKFQFKRQTNPSSLQFRFRKGHATHSMFQKFTSLPHNNIKSEQITSLVFHLEAALLKSSSLFPYFMLVAFEGGGLLRVLILFLLYPLVWLFGEKQIGLNIMVFVSFVGIKSDKFRIGSSVLPKFLLEDVGNEGFNAVMNYGDKRKIAVSEMPRIMVECFVKDYLRVDGVEGRELKVFCGYFLGLMEGKKGNPVVLKEFHGDGKMGGYAIGIGCFEYKAFDDHLFSYCKEIYWVTEAEKRKWEILPREKYPKPLIFHDGRLAFRPTPLASLFMFMWLPLGIFVSIIRFTSGTLLPLSIVNLVNSSTGFKSTLSISNPSSINSTNYDNKPTGLLYVCNHRTLLDPIYVSIFIMKPVTAVTYSTSRFTEIMSPIKTVGLTRDREKDKEIMEQELSRGDLAVCPEGTTCREPYLLRFSPLFAEMTDEIVPVAIDMQVSMFYGSTASGFKWLDSIYNLLNPFAMYSATILEKLPSSQTCNSGGKSRIEVANYVQNKIGKALGFECTSLTRKDKYMILAGNEGITK